MFWKPLQRNMIDRRPVVFMFCNAFYICFKQTVACTPQNFCAFCYEFQDLSADVYLSFMTRMATASASVMALASTMGQAPSITP